MAGFFADVIEAEQKRAARRNRNGEFADRRRTTESSHGYYRANPRQLFDAECMF